MQNLAMPIAGVDPNKARGRGLKFGRLARSYPVSDFSGICTTPASVPALGDLGGEGFLRALALRLSILKDRIENKPCETGGHTVKYLEGVVRELKLYWGSSKS